MLNASAKAQVDIRLDKIDELLTAFPDSDFVEFNETEGRVGFVRLERVHSFYFAILDDWIGDPGVLVQSDFGELIEDIKAHELFNLASSGRPCILELTRACLRECGVEATVVLERFDSWDEWYCEIGGIGAIGLSGHDLWFKQSLRADVLHYSSLPAMIEDITTYPLH